MKAVFRYFSYFAFLFVSLPLFAQNGTIRGTVQGSDGPLPAATIISGKRTALSDSAGHFALSLPPGSHLLTVSHTGYKKESWNVSLLPGQVQTIDFNMKPAEQLAEVVLLGSRSLVQRSNLTTAVPVDVIVSNQLLQTGQASLTQMLNFSVPSFNASRPLSNEPVTLRGLNPDQVLILVNGTRRHNLAYITPSGIRGLLGNGTVANDLNAIPFSAIEKIEILRDGAAAQYGSDAIAGVINIILKKSTGKTSALLQTGQFYKSDGETIIAGVNHGISFNGKGFLNFSADFRHNNSTYRGGEYKGTVYTNNKRIDDSIVMARAFKRNKVSNAGSAEHTLGGVVINGGYPLNNKTELFWTAIANNRKTVTLNGYTFPKNATRTNPELFPDGYGAKPYHYTRDVSGIAGIKGETKHHLQWEFTTAYGNNRSKWYNKDVNNASQYYTLGKNAPTRFYTGKLSYGQLTNNFDVTKYFSVNPNQLINVHLGTEWRLENFRMIRGEEASWKNYDPSGRKLGGVTGLVVPPENEVNKSRNVVGTYLDFEIELSKRLLVDLAGRYEYYSDFGGNLAGKIAARYKFSEHLSIRGSFNNGFRAPSLQQRYYSTTNRSGATSTGEPIIIGTFRNDSYVVKAFGVPTLQAERSLNASGGISGIFFDKIRLTVDAYLIQIRDRIVLSGRFDASNPTVKEILRPLPEINAVHFFANAINTKTYGADIMLDGRWNINKATFLSTLAGNLTQTRLFGKIKTAANLPADATNINTLFGRYERGRMQYGQPDNKFILSLEYKKEKIGLQIRNTRFGRTAILSTDLSEYSDEYFSPKILTDVAFTFKPASWLNISAGLNNIFNVHPDRLQDYRNTQDGALIYGMEATPFGFYGRFYFFSIRILR